MPKEGGSWKQHIARNFDSAVRSYESQSSVQKKSAFDLAELITNKKQDDINHVFEFGCGTGHLTKALYPSLTNADWLISDISPQMVATCMKSMPKGSNLSYTVMDAEDLKRSTKFDLICGNLAAQWFNNSEQTIDNLISHLKPGGLLAFSTLGPKTFMQWRKSFKAAGSDPVMPDYPNLNVWREMLSEKGLCDFTTKIYEAEYETAYDFARALKEIGAHAHSKGQKQLNPGLVRRVLREFDLMHTNKSVIADYEIFFICFRKD